MPAPNLRCTISNQASTDCPTQSGDNNYSLDWDSNVVSFISTCLHPGLVRRASFAACHNVQEKVPNFRKHRRNLSTATTVGVGRALIVDGQPQSGCYKSIPGHTRNISDPTNGWAYSMCLVKPISTCFNQLTEASQLAYLSNTNYVCPHSNGSSQHLLEKQASITTTQAITSSPTISSSINACTGDKSPIISNIDSHLICAPLPIELSKASIIHHEKSVKQQKEPHKSCTNSYTILLGLCLIMFMQSMVVSGLMSSSFTTLEKYFNLTSRQIGYLISCYEIASVVTTIVVSFLNSQLHNRLRLIGFATLVLAFGFGLFALPHFLTTGYRPVMALGRLQFGADDDNSSSIDHDKDNAVITQNRIAICSYENPFINSFNITGHLSKNTSIQTSPIAFNSFHNDSDRKASLIYQNFIKSIVFPIFCVAMLLAGIGASPLYVLAPTYLWDNLTRRQYPIYAALFYSSGGLGPACGFLAGAGFLSIHIDFPLNGPQNGVDRSSPLWLGAWWLGILVSSLLTFIVALPVISMPKQLHLPDDLSSDSTKSKIIDESSNNYASVPKFPEATVNCPRYSNELISCYDHVGNNQALTSITMAVDADDSSHHQCYQHHHHQQQQQQTQYTNTVVDEFVIVEQLDNNESKIYNVKHTLLDACRGAHTKCRQKLTASLLILHRVVSNPIWLGVTLTTVVEQSIVSAFLTFAAKYIQNLFQIPAYLASIHTGAVVVPSSLLGILTGALIMRHYRPKLHCIVSGLVVVIAVTVITSVILMSIGCQSATIAGITATYDGKPWPWRSASSLKPVNLTSMCNLNCRSYTHHLTENEIGQPSSIYCSPNDFNPVCWKRRSDTSLNNVHLQLTAPDYLTFFNPCYAGCETRVLENGLVKKYTNCKCVTPLVLNPIGGLPLNQAFMYINNTAELGQLENGVFDQSNYSIPFPSSLANYTGNYGDVEPGRCESKCPLYTLFLAMLFLHILCTGILQNPSNVITLSCVSPEDGSVALGLQIFFVRILAYIPAPIYFGQLFDLACQYRFDGTEVGIHNNSKLLSSAPSSDLSTDIAYPSTPGPEDAQSVGACLEYNLHGLPFIWLGMVFALKLVSLFGALVTCWLARRHYHETKSKDHENQKKFNNECNMDPQLFC